MREAEAPQSFVDAATIETTPHDYRLHLNFEEVDALVADLLAQSIFAFDTETNNLDANLAELVGMSFSWEKGKGHYVFIPDDREAALAVLTRFKPSLTGQKSPGSART